MSSIINLCLSNTPPPPSSGKQLCSLSVPYPSKQAQSRALHGMGVKLGREAPEGRNHIHLG